MSDSPFGSIALFGASGQIGSAILDALLHPMVSGYSPSIRVFFQASAAEEGKTEKVPKDKRAEVVVVDNFEDVDALAEKLKGVEAIVSALNGPGLEGQYPILEAAVKAGVKRFIPSEFGCHHLYRAPGSEEATLHKYWAQKDKFNEHLLLQPAILEEKMEFTIVGTGDFWDQPRETYWSAWANPKLPEKYYLPVVGDPHGKAEFTRITDLAQYVAALLARPSLSRNTTLNFVSDVLSQQEMADLLQSASGRPVEIDYVSEEEAHRLIAHPEEAPERAKQTAFAADFWYQVKLAQGQGRFRRHPSQIHNNLFPEVHATRFSEWLAMEVGAEALKE